MATSEARLDAAPGVGLVPAMAEFTIVLQRGEDPETTATVVDAADVDEAARLAFQLFDQRGGGTGYVALGRGRDDAVDWLGAFDLEPGREPRWEADS